MKDCEVYSHSEVLENFYHHEPNRTIASWFLTHFVVNAKHKSPVSSILLCYATLERPSPNHQQYNLYSALKLISCYGPAFSYFYTK